MVVPKAFSDYQIQYCNWYTVEVIKMKYRKSNYKKTEIKSKFKNNKKITLKLADYN